MINGNARLQGWMTNESLEEGFFFFLFSAKVQSESSESERNESFNESTVHGGRTHCLIRSLLDHF